MPNALDPQAPGPPERAIGESAGGVGLDVLSQIAHAAWNLPQRLTNESERMRYGAGYDPGPGVEAAMLTMGATPFGVARMGAGEAALGAGPIRAYHGSPYDFERFDMSKIGTGEGAQAYGHGLYFAENPATAEAYKSAVYRKTPITKEEAQRFMATKTPIRQGRMYETQINADPEHFLDWDKPLSEQPHVAEKIKPLMRWFDPSNQGNVALSEVADQIAINKGTIGQPGFAAREYPQEVADALRSAGIPGIKYLDQGSRNSTTWIARHPHGGINDFPNEQQARAFVAKNPEYSLEPPTQTRNYVLFRDDIIDILRKYGLVGMLGGGAAANALFPRQSGSNALQFQ